MGTVFLLRRAFFEASAKPERSEIPDLLTEAGKLQLRRALAGELPLRVHADDRQEIAAALRLAEELRAKLVLVGGSEAWDLVPLLARQHAGVVLPAAASSPREQQIESYPEYTARLPALLAAQGARFAFGSGDAGGVPRLRSRVALGLRYGLPEASALEALTLGAARLLGIEGEVGSIEPGKAADLVAIAGDPLLSTPRRRSAGS
jgi:imidazolonepropionase-like amidohydrolase